MMRATATVALLVLARSWDTVAAGSNPEGLAFLEANKGKVRTKPTLAHSQARTRAKIRARANAHPHTCTHAHTHATYTRAEQEGVISLASGMQYKVLRAGGGDSHPTASSPCDCHYAGTTHHQPPRPCPMLSTCQFALRLPLLSLLSLSLLSLS